MVILADIREPSVAAPIHALQRAAYAVEAQRIGCTDFPPLRETLDALQHSTDCFLAFVEGGSVVGCLSYEQVGTCVTVNRLVVSPLHFRRGIASALLCALDTRLPVDSVVCAWTADLNESAIKAYEKQGYRRGASQISQEGIALRQLHKQVGRKCEKMQ